MAMNEDWLDFLEADEDEEPESGPYVPGHVPPGSPGGGLPLTTVREPQPNGVHEATSMPDGVTAGGVPGANRKNNTIPTTMTTATTSQRASSSRPLCALR